MNEFSLKFLETDIYCNLSRFFPYIDTDLVVKIPKPVPEKGPDWTGLVSTTLVASIAILLEHYRRKVHLFKLVYLSNQATF